MSAVPASLSAELHILNLRAPPVTDAQIVLQAASLAFVAALLSGLCYCALAWGMDPFGALTANSGPAGVYLCQLNCSPTKCLA